MTERSIYSVIGLMSGTSIDGTIDAAHLLTDGEGYIERGVGITFEYEPSDGARPFHRLMKAAEIVVREAEGDLDRAQRTFDAQFPAYLMQQRGDGVVVTEREAEELANLLPWRTGQPSLFKHLIWLSAYYHAQAVKQLLKELGAEARRVQYVGYHGQTLYHAPHRGITVQVGDPQLMARETQLPIVYDFRSNDVKNGGQGAPLAPLYHAALARAKGVVPCVLVNIGGVSNASVISEHEEKLLAFDAGPGNTLIDRFVFSRGAGGYDPDGQYGARGVVQEQVLQPLLRSGIIQQGQNYLERLPPKSLDARDCVLIPELAALSLEDGCRTLEAFSAEAIASSCEFMKRQAISVPNRWVLCGGGSRNLTLVSELRQRLAPWCSGPVEVQNADELSWSSQFMEAELFAYLAVRSVRGLPLSVPGTTGVRRAVSGGRAVSP